MTGPSQAACLLQQTRKPGSDLFASYGLPSYIGDYLQVKLGI